KSSAPDARTITPASPGSAFPRFPKIAGTPPTAPRSPPSASPTSSSARFQRPPRRTPAEALLLPLLPPPSRQCSKSPASCLRRLFPGGECRDLLHHLFP